MLRKTIYPEIFAQDSRAQRSHLEHCIETLRQALMCNSGTGLVTFHWVKGSEEPYPDYDTYHQCRDPELVLDWALRNAVPASMPFGRPADVFELAEAPF